MADEIKSSGERSVESLNDSFKGLPANVQEVVDAGVKSQKDKINKATENANQLADSIGKIRDSASKKHRQLTDAENQYILNAQRQMNQYEVDALNLSSKEKRTILEALNTDAVSLTESQRYQVINALSQSFETELNAYNKQAKKIAELRKQGALDGPDYNAAMEVLDANFAKSTDNMVANMYKVMKAQGLTKYEMNNLFTSMGTTLKHAEEVANKSSDVMKVSLSAVADTASKMSKGTRKAGEDWNAIVLNPKTGEVKTNLQQVLNETAKSQEGWAKLFFAAKKAKIDSNAKAMIGVAALQNGIWDHMEWKDKKAMIATNTDREIAKTLTMNGTWKKLDLKTKEAIITAKGGKELSETLLKAGVWNELSLKNMKAMVVSKGTKSLIDTLDYLGRWQKLTPKEQQAIVSAKGGGELADLLIQFGQWKILDLESKQALVVTKGTDGLMEALDQMGIWDSLTPEEQSAIIKTPGKKELADLIVKYDAWGELDDVTKQALINSEPFMTQLQYLATKGNDFTAGRLVKEIGGDATGFDNMVSDISEKAKNIENNPVKKSVLVDKTQADKDLEALINPPYFQKPATVVAAADTKTADGKIDKTQGKADKLNKTKAMPQVDVNAHGSLKKVTDITKAIKDIPKSKKPNVDLNGHNSARKAKSISTEIGKIKGKTVDVYLNTYKTTYTKTTKRKNAHGTRDFEGGLSWVGDGKRKEVVYQPQSQTLFATPATDTLMDLERHSIIWPSIERFNKEFGELGLNAPKFAHGTANRVVETAKQIPSIVRNNTTVINNNAGGFDSIVEAVSAAVIKALGNVQPVLNTTVYGKLDTATARSWAKTMAVEFDRERRRGTAMEGGV